MQEFAAAEFQDLATLGPPRKRTHGSIVREAKAAEDAGGDRDASRAYHEVSVFHLLLPYHDIARHHKYDEAHMYGNAAKQVWAFVGNNKGSGDNKKLRWNTKHLAVPAIRTLQYFSACTRTLIVRFTYP